MSHSNTWEEKGLYRKFTGKISGEEILESNFELHQHPDFHSIQYIINDFTNVTDHTIEIPHTKAYATSDKIVSTTKGNLKISLIVTQPSLAELAKSYREQMIGEIFDCEIFTSLEDARKWTSSD